MSNEVTNTTTHAAAEPQTAPTPEQLAEQLRTMRDLIPDAVLLTPEQRRVVRNRAKLTLEIAQVQINTIEVSPLVQQAVGQPAEEARAILSDTIRWSAVEDAAKALLNGIVSANLARRQKLAFIGGQAYKVASSLAGDPGHSEVVQHVVEVRRLKRLARRKKTASPGNAEASPKIM